MMMAKKLLRADYVLCAKVHDVEHKRATNRIDSNMNPLKPLDKNKISDSGDFWKIFQDYQPIWKHSNAKIEIHLKLSFAFQMNHTTEKREREKKNTAAEYQKHDKTQR